jgi:hypothetical protein
VYYNVTALVTRARDGGMDVPTYRLTRWAQRVSDRTNGKLSSVSGALVSAGVKSHGLLTGGAAVGEPVHAVVQYAGRRDAADEPEGGLLAALATVTGGSGGVGAERDMRGLTAGEPFWSSAYVCTRDTLAAGLRDLKDNHAFNSWASRVTLTQLAVVLSMYLGQLEALDAFWRLAGPLAVVLWVIAKVAAWSHAPGARVPLPVVQVVKCATTVAVGMVAWFGTAHSLLQRAVAELPHAPAAVRAIVAGPLSLAARLHMDNGWARFGVAVLIGGWLVTHLLEAQPPVAVAAAPPVVAPAAGAPPPQPQPQPRSEKGRKTKSHRRRPSRSRSRSPSSGGSSDSSGSDAGSSAPASPRDHRDGQVRRRTHAAPVGGVTGSAMPPHAAALMPAPVGVTHPYPHPHYPHPYAHLAGAGGGAGVGTAAAWAAHHQLAMAQQQHLAAWAEWQRRARAADATKAAQ